MSQNEAVHAGTSPAAIDCRNPATGESLGRVAIDGPERVAEVVARARSAQRQWAAAGFAARRQVLRAMLDYTLAEADSLCHEVVLDSGKTRENAIYGEIWPVCEKLRWTLEHGERHLLPETASAGLFKHKRALTEFHPLGVIAVITPWNYPFQNIMGPTIHALMAGNAVVIKPSEWVAWSSARFQRVFDAALDAGGFSRDLVQLVQGHGDTGKALVQSGVDKVVFTGSQDNGRRVLEASVKNLTPVILELGGKDALIVCDDAHLEQAVHAILAGVFVNAGQNCLAAERVLVQPGIYDALQKRLIDETAALRQGPPSPNSVVDMGAIVSPLQLDRIEKLVNRAVAQGARVLTGGQRVLEEQGQYFAPTILADVTPEMEIMHQEVFGPVLLLCRVDDDAQAITVANGTTFGLSSTIMSRNPQRARSIHQRLLTGSSSVNDFGLTYMAQDLGFGGVGGSGFGRLNGRDGLRAMTNPKAVLEDRLGPAIPARIYPVGDKTYQTVRDALRLIYGSGSLRRRAVLELASGLWSRKRPGD